MKGFLPMKLFGNKIEPSCWYCELGKQAPDGKMVLCIKEGVVAPYYSCRRYQYAPLKRTPSRTRSLPKYDMEDFEL